MKARAGWRETVRQENTGADGQPMVTEIVYRWRDSRDEEPALSHDDEPRRHSRSDHDREPQTQQTIVDRDTPSAPVSIDARGLHIDLVQQKRSVSGHYLVFQD